MPPVPARPGSDARSRSRPPARASACSYTRATRLLQELQAAHGDGSFGRRLAQLAWLDVLVLDDLAIAPISGAERQDLLELLDDRVGSPLDANHQPAAHQRLAPVAGRAHHRRCHHGPAAARRVHPRAQGRVFTPGQAASLTASEVHHRRAASTPPCPPRRPGVASAAAAVDKAAKAPNSNIEDAFGTGLSTRRRGAACITRQVSFHVDRGQRSTVMADS